jgi:hypothetical protein
MPSSVVTTLFVAALITVILFPSSSATHTVPPIALSFGLAMLLHALSTTAAIIIKILPLRTIEFLIGQLLW